LLNAKTGKESLISVNFHKIVDKGNTIYFKNEIETQKKLHPYADATAQFPMNSYKFIVLQPASGTVALDCNDYKNGKLFLNHNGETLVFTPSKTIEDKVPSIFQFNDLFYKPEEQRELSDKLSRIPEVNSLMNNLNECVKKKDEGCFKKYFFPVRKDGEERRNKFFHEILLRGHIYSFPKALSYYEKTRNTEMDYDIDLPPNIESMVNSDTSKVWEWLGDAFKLSVDGKRYIALIATKIDEPLESVEIHLLKTSTYVKLRRDKSNWYLKDLSLTSTFESIHP